MNEFSNINFGQDQSSAGWDWLTAIQGITKPGLVHSFCMPLYILTVRVSPMYVVLKKNFDPMPDFL